MKTTIQIPFEIGKPVWKMSHGKKQKVVTCPECLGSCIVTLTMGNGEVYTLGCAACRSGYDGSRGTITEYTNEVEPKLFTPRRFGIDSDGFWFSESTPEEPNYTMVYADKLYNFRDECERACEIENKRLLQEVCEQAIAGLASKRKDLAWSVHYWRRERARKLKDVETIDRRLHQIDARKSNGKA